ncbi:translocation/assembly module TamB domain-containing protein [Salinimicrobium sp. TH3]|uniref:translocation/assembly module TamB domain-containing protein n=1 Tax=Salinimicrobium sp. TH3 TaxID=2997342 RepID=UPI0022744A96|nr:translocation/assembly module TamB [Salinimicrobium sp. TH3]MCY2687065.1 translocation/assembly module TamB domain-containing protein [Salinimicrobium sp. TH3]
METKKNQKEKKKRGSGLKLFFKILLGIFIFIFLLLLFIRSPWGQGIIVDKLVNYITNKTNTVVEVDRLFITFGGDLSLEGLYMEDEEGDTLIYSRELQADISLMPLIKGKGFYLNSLDWNGGIANIDRTDTIQGFNFDFLTEAFATADTTATTTPADTTASQMEIRLGDINIENFRLTYDDKYLGIDTKVALGGLQLEMQKFELDSMRFEAGDVILKNTRFKYAQTKPAPDSPQEDTIPLPFLSAENLKVNNVAGSYTSVPDGIVADVNIDDLYLKLPAVDLENTLLVIDKLDLNDSRIYLQTKTKAIAETEQLTASDSTATEGFEWPEWEVKASDLSIQNTDFRYWVNDSRPTPGTFNPEAVGLKDLDLKIPELILANKSLEAKVEALNFREASGLNLNRTQFVASINEDRMLLQDLLLKLNGNMVEGNLVIDYQSLNSFIENPKNATVDLNLPQFNVDLQDLYRFQPDLQQNEYISELAKKGISGSLFASGELSKISIESANINWGNTALSSTGGTIYNATDPDNLKFDLPQLNFNSSRSDLSGFLASLDLGIQLPEQISLSGNFSGTPEDISVDAILNSSAGKINVDGRFVTAPGIAFNADLKVTKLELGQLLQNKALGSISLQMEASGSGANLNELDAMADGNISSFTYNNYQFEDIELYAQLEDGDGFVNVDYKDENLNMELQSFVELDSVAPKVALNLNLMGADLQALGLTNRQINTGLDLRATFEGNAESFDMVGSINEGVFVYDDETYLLGSVDLLAHVRPDTTSIDVDNRMLDLRLSSNAGPMDFINALDRHYQSYYSIENQLDTVRNPVNIELRAEVSPSPILEDVFLPQLEEMDTLKVRMDFEEKTRELAAQVSLPYLNYFGSEIDSLQFNMDSDKEKLAFDFGLKRLNAGPLAIKETILEGELVNEELLLDFTSNYEGERLMHFSSLVSKEDDVLRIHINPKEFILNASPWEIDSDNAILIGENKWSFNQFELTRNNQLLRASNQMDGIAGEHIGIEFDNFKLASIFSYFNPEKVLAAGSMNGSFIIEEPFGTTGLVADLKINEFGVLDVPLGELSLVANSTGGDTYNIDLGLRGNADLDLTGSYIASEKTANLDLQLDLNEIKMEVIENFADGAITAADGSFSGAISVSGTTLEPQYEGNIHFNNAAFTVAALGAPFVFPNEDLRINNDGIYMENFMIRDLNNNEFVLDGSVLTETYLNPEFDLSFNAENFTVVNSEEGANELFYGKAVVDVTGSLTGDLELPIVEMDLTVGEETNLTYIIPEANVELEEREGVVVFVNRENPNQILTQTKEEEDAVSFSGFKMNSYISVEENATFTVVISEETGDNFRGTGEGELLFDIYPNGRTTMSGRLELQDGHYEMSLYNLVTRKFDIMEGSSIVWAGDPLDADLNITASYSVETSASALMAPQLTSVDMDVRQRYRQELEFLVYLKIGGEINAPTISFGLDMPEDEQGSLSGQVYGRVQQLNQQENELNKQVFSLLVLNRFFPDSGSDGASGGTLSFARDNLNSAISDQLNVFSDRLLGETGVDLNFGLDSYTDYQGAAPEERTQLDITAQKKLFDDRLIVSVGSEVDLQGSSQVEESTPVIGNVSLEYLLTEDGRLRLEAFRRRSYENVIDGQLIISGLSLIFTQDFNKFRELWSQILSEEKRKQQANQNEPEKTEQ